MFRHELVAGRVGTPVAGGEKTRSLNIDHFHREVDPDQRASAHPSDQGERNVR